LAHWGPGARYWQQLKSYTIIEHCSIINTVV
jgi:hypothetical protein